MAEVERQRDVHGMPVDWAMCPDCAGCGWDDDAYSFPERADDPVDEPQLQCRTCRGTGMATPWE